MALLSRALGRIAAIALPLWAGLACMPASAGLGGVTPDAPPSLEWVACDTGLPENVRCGIYYAPENREDPVSRTIPLWFAILPARDGSDDAVPIAYLPGGPGVASRPRAAGLANGWMTEHNTLILLDQRGTGEAHRLDCPVGGNDDDLQSYFEPVFAPDADFSDCRDRLSRSFDLSRYSTADALRCARCSAMRRSIYTAILTARARH